MTCEWSPNGMNIITGSSDGHIKIWQRIDKPLIADAGGDKIIQKGIVTRLDGSASQGDILEDGYRWDIYKGNGIIGSSPGKIVDWIFDDIGQYNVMLNVTDGEYYDCNMIHIAVIDDNEKPLVEIINPKNNSAVAEMITISGTATDNQQIIGVFIQFEEGGWLKCTGNMTWTFNLNTNGFRNGKYHIYVKAFDGIQYSEINFISLIFNNSHLKNGNISPKIAISFPCDGDEVKGIIWINGTTTSNSLIISIDLSTSRTGISVSLPAFGTTNWYAQWNTKLIQDGWWMINATAIDEAHLKTKISINLYVNNSGMRVEEFPPEIKILMPIEGSLLNGIVNISGTAADNIKLYIVQISFNNLTWYDSTYPEQFIVHFDTSSLKNGNYTIVARAYDGYQFSYDSIRVIINNTEKSDILNQSNLESSIFPLLGLIFFIAFVLFIIGMFRIKILNLHVPRFILMVQISGIIITLLFSSLLLFNNYHSDPHNTVINEDIPVNVVNEKARAPDFTFVTMDGKLITNDNQMGSVIVIQFFISQPNDGMGPTSQRIQDFAKIREQFEGEWVTFITLECWGWITQKDFETVFIENGGNWNYNFDFNHRISDNYGGAPPFGSKNVIIDKKGYEIFRGEFEEKELISIITENLNK